MSNIRRAALLVWLLTAAACGALAQTSAGNAQQARQLFDQVYDMVFGEKGSSLHYAVNIIGLYKTEGTIWYKGKKSKFTDERYTAWNDGRNYYRVERKKRTVTVYGATAEDRDKYATKFTFSPENYTYRLSRNERGPLLTLHAKKGVKGMKEIQAQLDGRTRYPLSLRIKFGIFSTTVRISRFKCGVSADLFVFPHAKYKDYEWIDKRTSASR